MRVFLTGASGFIGSHVTRALLAAGHDVAILAVPNESLWRISDSVNKLSVLSGELGDISAFQDRLAQWHPDACIHLAWYAEPQTYLHSPANITALTGSIRLIQVLAEIGCKYVLAAGTCAEYDTDIGYLSEDSPIKPSTLYAATKVSLHLTARHIAADAGMQFGWARLFYPYGPYEDRRRVLPSLICALQKGQPFASSQGQQVRDYIHVQDVASAFLILTEKQAAGVFNISSNTPVTLRQCFEMIGQLTGRIDLIRFGELPYRDWDPMFVCGNNKRLVSQGWSQMYR